MDAFTFLKEHTPLFSGVADRHIEDLAGASSVQSYASGKTVLFQGVTVDALHVVCTGKLAVLAKAPGEGVRTMAQLQPGDVFGETSIFEMGTAGATVKSAAEGTYVLVIPQDAFRRLLAEDAAFVERLKALIAARRAPPKAPKA